MRNSVLEITDQEYLIKLDKTEFDLSFIQSLLKRIQTEKTFFLKFGKKKTSLAEEVYKTTLEKTT